MELYVDDMVVRSRPVEDHVRDLAEVFGQVRKYDMHLNPTKCTFGVPIGKLLGLMLTARGIEANSDKCKVMLDMRSPQNLKEVQMLVGRLTSLSRFIPRLAERIKPIVKTMKKDAQGRRNDQCEATFGEVKEILACPPIMGRLDSGHDLQLFLAVTDATFSVALVHETLEFIPIYFISRILRDSETRYEQLEKVALVLLMEARRLRPYFQGHQLVARTNHLMAKVLRKPDLARRIIGWSIELSEFEL